MAFGDNFNNKSNSGEGSNSENVYLRLKPGTRSFRILDTTEHTFWQYWLTVNAGGSQQARSIVVGTVDNPIRRYMNSLGEDHPNFRKPSRQFALNVVDRTPVIVAADGSVTYPDEKDNIGPNARPHNRVMILSFGPQLMEQLISFNGRMRSPVTGKPMAIQEFDLSVHTRGKGRDTTRVVIPNLDLEPLPEEIVAGPRYNLNEAFRPMPDEAQEALLAGTDFGEVLKSLGWTSVKPLW